MHMPKKQLIKITTENNKTGKKIQSLKPFGILVQLKNPSANTRRKAH